MQRRSCPVKKSQLSHKKRPAAVFSGHYPTIDNVPNFVKLLCYNLQYPFYCIEIYLKRGNLSNDKTVWLQSVDAVWGKVAGKSRRIWRSGLTSSTEDESADLPRDCPQCAAAGCIFHKRQYPTIKNTPVRISGWGWGIPCWFPIYFGWGKPGIKWE